MNIYKTFYYEDDKKLLSTIVAYDIDEARSFIEQRGLGETFDGEPVPFRGEVMPDEPETVRDQARFMAKLSKLPEGAMPLKKVEFAIERILTKTEATTSVHGLWNFAYEALLECRANAPGVAKTLEKSRPPTYEFSISAYDFIDKLVLEYGEEDVPKSSHATAKFVLRWYEGIREAMKVSTLETLFLGNAGKDLGLSQQDEGVIETIESLEEAHRRIENLSLQALVSVTTSTLFVRGTDTWRDLVLACHNETIRRGEPEKQAEALFGRLLK